MSTPRLIIAGVLFFFPRGALFSQERQNFLLEQRLTDYLRKTSNGIFLTASRYVPTIQFRGMGTWASPQSSILIDEVPFDAFPLNLTSADYVPIDLLSIDSVSVSDGPSLSPYGRFGGGAVVLHRRPISDSLTVAGRFYGGSETGDPVLHKYTVDNPELFNKNKIGYSGVASVSDRAGDLRYRLTGGLFGYFSTGYVGRDRVIISYIDRETFSRPNRNYLGSLELEYSGENGKRASLYGGINGLVGWEHMPFLPTFAFFEGNMNTVRLHLRDFLKDVDIAIRWDGLFLSMKNQYLTKGGEYSASTAVLHPVWRLVHDEASLLKLFAQFSHHAIDVPTNTDSSQQFFPEDIRRTSWAMGADLEHQEADFMISGDIRIDHHITRTNDVSAQVRVSHQAGLQTNIQAAAASVALAPNVLELYGRFSLLRNRPVLGRTDTFSVAGNRGLQTGRSNSLELSYRRMSSSSGFTATWFYQILERAPDRFIDSAIRAAVPGDVVFSGHYGIIPRQMMQGVEATTLLKPDDGLTLLASYVFTYNKAYRSLPKHRIRANGTLLLAPGTILSATFHGQTKTFWQEFVVRPKDDDFAGKGQDGTTPEFWSIDFSLSQKLGTIWIGREIEARLELQNILNRRVQYIPIGIPYDTAVIGYISLKL